MNNYKSLIILNLNRKMYNMNFNNNQNTPPMNKPQNYINDFGGNNFNNYNQNMNSQLNNFPSNENNNYISNPMNNNNQMGNNCYNQANNYYPNQMNNNQNNQMNNNFPNPTNNYSSNQWNNYPDQQNFSPKNYQKENNDGQNESKKLPLDISEIYKLRDQIMENQTSYIDFHRTLFLRNIFEPIPEFKQMFPYISSDDIKNNFKNNKNKIIQYINQIAQNEKSSSYPLLSCIYGAFLGDAIGTYAEFEKPSKELYKRIFQSNPPFGDEPGQFTDDSEMAMSLAFGIMAGHNKLNLSSSDLYYYYGCWLYSKPKDFGNTIKEALKHFNLNTCLPNQNFFDNFKENINQSNNGSLSNGFIMRISPFVAWYYARNERQIKDSFQKISNDDKKLFELYCDIKKKVEPDTICTHPNQENVSAAACIVLMAILAISGMNPNTIIKLLINFYTLLPEKVKEFPLLNEYDVKISKYFIDNFYLFHQDNFDFWNYFAEGENQVFKKMGWYAHSLRLTIYFLEKIDKYGGQDNKDTYDKIMNDICNIGGDTDTNAAIVGTVIGPIVGLKNMSKLDTMIKVSPEKRGCYSPFLIFMFILYLEATNREAKENISGDGFVFMMLMILYGGPILLDIN